MVDKNGSIGKNFSLTVKETTAHEFIFSLGCLELDDKKEMEEAFGLLYKAGSNDKLILRIDSTGGVAHVMFRIINFCQHEFCGKTITYLDAEASSAAAFLFLCGKERVIFPYSVIMFHNYSVSFSGKEHEIEALLSSCKDLFNRFCFEYLTPHLSEKEIQQLIDGKDFYFNAREMCRRGIATHVMQKGKKMPANQYIGLVSSGT